MAAKTAGEAFLFYFERWRASRAVQRMSFAERGMFLEMMIEQWMRGDLPDNPQAVAQAIATQDAQVGELESSWPVLRRQFVTVDRAPDRIINTPLEKIRRAKAAWMRKQAKFGRDGGKAAARNRLTRKDQGPIGSLQAAYSDPIPIEMSRREVEKKREERTVPRAHMGTVFDGALPRDHKSHVFCDPGFSVCVPAAVHAKLLGPLSRKFDGDREKAHQALKDWYLDVANSLPADFVPPSDAFAFWQKRFDAAFASQSLNSTRMFPEPTQADVDAQLEILRRMERR